MSIFSKIVSAAKGAIGGFIGGGPAGAVVGGVGGLLGGGKKLPSPPGGAGTWSGSASSRVRRVLPGAGTIAAGVAGYAGGRAMQGYQSNGYAPRRRTRGFSSRDVRQAKRLMKMLKDVSAAAPKPRTIRAASSCN